MKLETEMEAGRKLDIGTFYYFLKDSFSIGGEDGHFVYGNIYMGDHWIMTDYMPELSSLIFNVSCR